MEFFQPLTIVMFLLAVIAVLAVVLAKERTQYFTATRLIKSMEIKEYLLRENEECLHKFALKSEGGVCWITTDRIIYRHSHRFSLLFFAELKDVVKIEKKDNMIIIFTQDGRKQRLELFPENVERVFNVLAKQLINWEENE